MRIAKRWASFLLALVMLMALTLPGLAVEGEAGGGTGTEETTDPTPTTGSTTTTTGSITITGAYPGETYKAYKIFDVSYDTANEAYVYIYDTSASNAWADFFSDAKDDTDPLKGKGLDYVTKEVIGGVTYVTEKSGLTEEDKAAFAKAALLYAQSKNITATGSATANNSTDSTGKTTVTISNLPVGYYLMDASTGTMAMLGTTKPTFLINDKNTVPTVDKTVQEGTTYGLSNDANIGDTVNFKTEILVKGGARNFVLHDTMAEGLTFDSTSVSIVWYKATGVTGTPSVYTYEKDTDSNDKANPLSPVPTEADRNKTGQYTLETTGLTDSCTFEITFEQDFLDTLNTGDKIVITYSATLNEDAVVGVPGEKEQGNRNTTHLEFGDKQKTEDRYTTTYTWELPIYKYTASNDTEVPLSGAVFQLYREGSSGSGFSTDDPLVDFVEIKETTGSTELTEPTGESSEDETGGSEGGGTGTAQSNEGSNDETGSGSQEGQNNVEETQIPSTVVGYQVCTLEHSSGGSTGDSSSSTSGSHSASGHVTTVVSGSDGMIHIEGLDSGTYYLVETKAPDGYNLLNEHIKIVVYGPEADSTTSESVKKDGYVEYIGCTGHTTSEGSTTYTYETDGNGNAVYSHNVDPQLNYVKILNSTGTELPSTGGMGTTLFYVVGTILAVGAAILLVTRRRMNAKCDREDRDSE